MAEIKRETETRECGRNEKAAAPHESEQRQHKVTGNAYGRHRNRTDDRKGAVVHDAAVPFLVDGAGLCARGVVDLKGQRGNDDAGES